MHLFDLSTSKKGPRLSVFNTFHLEMCFALQRRALFQRLNFQKWSAPKVFLTCWLPNALRATAACTFSISPLPKVVRALGAFNILTSTCAPRHTCIQFLISHLRTCRFSEPTFRPSGATKHWKNTVFRDFSTLRALIFFLLIFFRLTLSLLTLSLPCLFPPLLLHIVGSVIPKLPSCVCSTVCFLSIPCLPSSLFDIVVWVLPGCCLNRPQTHPAYMVSLPYLILPYSLSSLCPRGSTYLSLFVIFRNLFSNVY